MWLFVAESKVFVPPEVGGLRLQILHDGTPERCRTVRNWLFGIKGVDGV
jgi:hypothetical protein